MATRLGARMNVATISIKRGERILIVEDNRERQDWFLDQLRHEVVTITQDPATAIEDLRLTPPEMWAAIFLDYDLGPEPIKDSTITSKPVVEYLNEVCTTRQSQRNIIIHSQNVPGAKWIQALLPGAFKLPFGSFKIEEKYA
jgi:CheY-like chemotaxis protein